MNRYRSLSPCRRLPLCLGVMLALCLAFGGGRSAEAAPPDPPPITLIAFAAGFAAPVGLEAPNDGTGRLFVVEQGGLIRIIQAASVLAAPFLDVSALIESGGEKGLLGLAFHPSFRNNRRFFVNYTRRVGTQLQSVISEFSASIPNPNQADALSERQLLIVNQPFDNHNGGQLAFGPDGFLYIAFGDGGSAGDPLGNGQNLQTLLGKILRIDVNGAFSPGKQYAIPADNPFALGGGLPEIWAYGLRNPWRFSFDLTTGRLLAGDVGQANYEEVDLIVKGGNFGWNIMEGNHCYPPGSACNPAGLIPPISEYAHDAAGGTAVIGGFVYRGASFPRLAGDYVFGDLSSGHVWRLREVSAGSWQQTLLLTHNLTVSAFARDVAGELYLVDYVNGSVLKIRPGPPNILDLNADGKPDFLWRYTPTGALAYWLMNGVIPVSFGAITTVSPDWQLAGTPDLNGDGEADLLWRHTPTGAIAYWIMSGTSIASTGTAGSADPNWRIAGTPDLNGDGKPDILWQHTPTGTVAAWFMNGATMTSSAVIAAVGTDWEIAGTPDLNADGKPDILWRQVSTGLVAYWLMDGITILSGGGISTVPANWRIVGTPDLSGDGRPDILWFDTATDTVAYWFMSGTAVAGSGGIAAVPAGWDLIAPK